jgi:hypothetical protein
LLLELETCLLTSPKAHCLLRCCDPLKMAALSSRLLSHATDKLSVDCIWKEQDRRKYKVTAINNDRTQHLTKRLLLIQYWISHPIQDVQRSCYDSRPKFLHLHNTLPLEPLCARDHKVQLQWRSTRSFATEVCTPQRSFNMDPS